MKKIIIPIIALCASAFAAAQTSFYVYKSDRSTVEYAVSEVDSISFVKPAAPTTGTADGHAWVDLGLPSGLKWAACNVGATAPEAYGDYYAWGETAAKADYSWATYKHGSAAKQLTKYCTDASYGKDGFTDGKTALDPEDDAAHTNWGGAWRMPTADEWQELVDNCDWTWTARNGVNGYEVKGKNGNSIFLPAAGYRIGGNLNKAGDKGFYWSGSLRTSIPYNALGAILSSGGVNETAGLRCCGYSVRPVQEGSTSTALQPAESVAIHAENGRVVCGGDFRIYDLLGRDVTRLNGSLNGVYVVKCGEKAVKIVAR